MKFKLIIAVLLLIPSMLIAQKKKSNGDDFFFGYQYQKAITAYKKEMEKNPLTNQQLLNLADAYFNIGKYDNATELYLAVNEKDTIISLQRFNKLLQSLSKNSDKERVKTFLLSKRTLLPPELLENSEFNYNLLEETRVGEGFDITNLGVNSPQGDFSPAFYKDGLLFSSSRTQKKKEVYAPSGESYLAIFFGRLNVEGGLMDVKNFDRIPKSKFHQSTPFYSDKLATFFYSLSNTEDGELAFDENGKNAMAIGTLTNSGQFGFLLKSLSTSFYYPFFDDKTGRLYFAANFDDGYGGTDLYYVYTNNGQIMSAPINLGPRINSPGNEIAPYVYNGDLYFSSDVFYGLGGMDVYKSTIMADDSYTIPINLGNGINSVSDDFGFIIRERQNNGFTGYFASNRSGGKGSDDLYVFNGQEVPGIRTFVLRGKIVDLGSKGGLDNAQIRLLNAEGEVIKEKFSILDGVFSVEVPWQSQLTVEATKEGYSIFSTAYSEESMKEIQQSPYIIGLVKIEDLLVEKEGKKVLKLNPFYFDKGKTEVNTQVATELDKVLDAVLRFPQLKFKIETHTDSRGSTLNNKKLSQDRSNAIKDYLLKNGLPSSAIVESIGYGEEMIMNNCTNGTYCLDFLHKQNERTLIVVVE